MNPENMSLFRAHLLRKRSPLLLFLLSLLLICGTSTAVHASVIITAPPVPPLRFQGVVLFSGAFGFCTSEGCTLVGRPIYGFAYGTEDPTFLPAPPGHGSAVLDVSGTLGPTSANQLFLPYPIGHDLHGTLEATLMTDPLFGPFEEVRFAVATTYFSGGIFGDVPDTFLFSPTPEEDYFLVVYGSLGRTVSYHVTVSALSAVPEPSILALFGLGVAGLASAVVRRNRHHKRRA